MEIFQGKEQFWWLFPLKSIGSLCCDVRKNGYNDWDAV